MSFIDNRHRPVRNGGGRRLDEMAERAGPQEPVNVESAEGEDEAIDRAKDDEFSNPDLLHLIHSNPEINGSVNLTSPPSRRCFLPHDLETSRQSGSPWFFSC